MPATAMPEQQSDDAPPPGVVSIQPSLHPKQMSFPLPLTPHTTLHVQTTRLETSSLIFLTASDPSNSTSTSSLGSFIYAMPNVSPGNLPLHTVPKHSTRVFPHRTANIQLASGSAPRKS